MKTIMVVDNETTSLLQMEDILRRFGYGVIAESHAPSALVHIREGAAVDLVITDYRMADMDGLELLNGLRRIAPALPLIMITAEGDIESYLKARNLGAFEYLSKPVRIRDLVCILRTAFYQPAQAA